MHTSEGDHVMTVKYQQEKTYWWLIYFHLGMLYKVDMMLINQQDSEAEQIN